ncbi:methionyl-tRNA formyltransferase [Mumia zhuanghuii]|uniref:Methionyl-tRNA formyltransferase n=1 Tax=Mumia zhuanghuii TaxID=2585211 RepID=A0A5C4MJH1_9ACTN|nr:methionyl-tRNA formyltransferase [Mumia zhuanghuii]TNC44132.1 methionyl-tRNA formyltransferase [Mumia zhuanghuii]TNC47927.1 methionyl-tRNA formyltransferase [Mumia zhuanghuii]
MRLVFAGTPEVALPSLDALVASDHEVVAVVTRPDARAGRGRTLRPSPVAERAQELGLEVLRPPKPSDPAFVERLREIAPDCAPVVAYGGLVPADVLSVPRLGWINLHFSVLPAWRGAAPVQHALIAGDEVTGASVFSLVPELDAGPVYGLLTERIRPEDTAGTLLARLADLGAGLLTDVVDHLALGDIEARPQQEEGLTYAPKLTTDDARVDWTAPAFAVDRRIRGCTPAPGAWTTYDGERLKLGPLSVVDGPAALAPGELAVTKNEVRVGTGTSDVLLDEVQPHGKKAMVAADWARGVRPEPGARLG